MDQTSASTASDSGNNMMDTSLFSNSSTMLSAVASLIKQHQGNKDKPDDSPMASPMLVLTSLPGKDSLHANVVLGSNASSMDSPRAQNEQFPSLEQVHALAQASLVASTRLDIAQQLAHLEDDDRTANKAAGQASKKDRKSGSQQKMNGTGGKSNGHKGKPGVTEKKFPANGSNMLKIPEHPQPKALVCSFDGCNRKFAWQHHLNYHEMTHTNNRQHKCPHESCGKMFYTAQRLNVHLRTHTGEKPFQCSHEGCGKTFTTAGNLKNHERIHTGEQPFECDYPNCKRRFTEHSSLRKHKRTHSGDKPFECQICGKKFSQSGSRQHHIARHRLDEEIRASYAKVGQKECQKRADTESPGQPEKVLLEDGSHLACSPQVLVLNNSYPGLPTSESIVFSHGLSDHIVTVTTQTMDQSMAESEALSLPHSLLNTEGLQDQTLQEKSSELVVLSETPIYQHEDPSGDIVYATDILDHEEVTTEVSAYTSDMTNSNYTSHAEVVEASDYGADITQANYTSQSESVVETSDFHDTMMGQSEHFGEHSVKIELSRYMATECVVPSEYGCSKGKKTDENGVDEQYSCGLDTYPELSATDPQVSAPSLLSGEDIVLEQMKTGPHVVTGAAGLPCANQEFSQTVESMSSHHTVQSGLQPMGPMMECDEDLQKL